MEEETAAQFAKGTTAVAVYTILFDVKKHLVPEAANFLVHS